MRERMKLLRKYLKMNQREFGQKIGLSDSAISYMESGRNDITEQTLKSICREFNVDYTWLTLGVGEMFSASDETFYESVDRIMAGENEFYKNLFKSLASWNDEEIAALETVVNKLSQLQGPSEDDEKKATKKAD